MPSTDHARQIGPSLCRGVGLPVELGMPDKVSMLLNSCSQGRVPPEASYSRSSHRSLHSHVKRLTEGSVILQVAK